MRELFRTVDFGLLNAATSLAHEHQWASMAAYACAQILILVFPLALFWLWEKPGVRARYHGARKAVVMALVTFTVALAIKSAVGIVIMRQRPFVSHPDLLHLDFHVDPGSFPSGHSLVAFAIAMSLFLSGYRRLGGTLLGVAALIALGRVFAGVHYPSDVVAGSLLGMGVAWYFHREASSLKRYLPNE